VRWGSLCLVFILCFGYQAQVEARPKVGLVLAGGGAKGIIHVGVLRWLEEHHIPVDYITGTSIGSYVGALYALGYSSAEIESIMLSLDWNSGYSDRVPREDLPLRSQKLRDTYNIPIDLGMRDYQLRVPSGWLQGQTMMRLLYESIGILPRFDDFYKLPIPFYPVTANLETRQVVPLKQGDLIKSVRASMSVPGILSPVLIDGQQLVDGGIANNLPVDLIRTMGADIVIAVDIASEPLKGKQLNTPLSALEQLSVFLVLSNTEHQKKLLGEGDVLITPEVEGMSTTDFNLINQDSITKGYQAAQAQSRKLLEYKLEKQEYFTYREAKLRQRDAIQDIIYRPMRQVVIDSPASHLKPLIKEQVQRAQKNYSTRKNIEDIVTHVYNLDRFERVEAYIRPTEDLKLNDLIIIAEPKSWGPNYLNFGLSFEKGVDYHASVDLDFSFLQTDLNSFSAEWLNEVQLARETFYRTHFYQPLDRTDHFFSSVSYKYKIDEGKNWLENFDYTITQERHANRFDLGIGYNFTRQFLIQAGAWMDFTSKLKYSALSIDWTNYYYSYAPYILMHYDQQDNAFFPQKGNALMIYFSRIYQKTTKQIYSDSSIPFKLTSYQDNILPIDYFEVIYTGSLKIGRNTFSTRLEYGRIDHDGFSDSDSFDFSMYQFNLGGFLSLSGFRPNILVGDRKILGLISYNYELSDSFLGLPDTPLYGGVSMEVGNVWLKHELRFGNQGTKADIDKRDLIYASAVYLGSETKIGTLTLALGANTAQEVSLYVYLGKKF
tara:strand:+ start:30497 stop:32818 length:2322 start_codon:yes stop_codon:yes gene_type:complete